MNFAYFCWIFFRTGEGGDKGPSGVMRAVPGTVYAVHARKAVTRGDHSRRFGSVLAFVLSFVLSPSSSKTLGEITVDVLGPF